MISYIIILWNSTMSPKMPIFDTVKYKYLKFYK